MKKVSKKKNRNYYENRARRRKDSTIRQIKNGQVTKQWES